MKKPTRMQKSAVGGMLALTLLTAGMPAGTASANTSLADLQAQITQLLAQIEALKNGSNPNTCTPFTADLLTGRTGSDVTRLQQFLIQAGHTIPAGATGYFGEQTRQAVASYQRTQNITPAVGYFGPITRAKINATCTTVPNPTNPGTTTPTTPANPLQGEAELRDFSFTEGDDMTLEEGDADRTLAEISFDVENGDALLQRIDLVFTPNGTNNEKDPWDVFEEITLWSGNDRLARIDTSRESNWRDENRTTGSHTLRISGLDYQLDEDTDATFTVRTTLARSIRGTNDGETWNIAVPNNGIRALDADRVLVETGDGSEIVTLDIDEAGTRDELIIRTSSDDIDATSLILERNKRSGFTPVFAFDIDTDSSVNDIEIRSIPVSVTVGTGTVQTFVRDARIIIDGKTYTRHTIVDGNTGTITFTFRRGELEIDAKDRVTAVVELDFKPLAAEYEGTTISSRIAGADIVAEGADDLSSSQLSGVSTSDTHTLLASGAVVQVENTSAVVTSVSGDQNVYATYRVEIEVTAAKQDIYFPTNTNAVTYSLRDASGNTIVASSTAVVSSDAREQSGYYFIPEGQTKTLTLEVTYQPQTALTSARMSLMTLNYAATATTPNQTWVATPASQFETSVVTIVN